MKKTVLLFIVFIAGFNFVFSQTSQQDPENRQFDIGVGVGLNYAQFGVNAGYIASPKFMVFANLGYMLAGLGYNAGLAYYIKPKSSENKFRVNLKAMYGTNAAIYVVNAASYNQTYLGPTVAMGLEFRFGKYKNFGANIDIGYAFRNQEYTDDFNYIKNNGIVYNDPFPLQISLGYHKEF